MASESNVDDRLAGRAPEQVRDLDGFDYNAPAEVFVAPRRPARSRARYQRFDTAAEALRFVIEGLPASALPSAYLLVEEARFRSAEIRYLYDSVGYPLPRAAGNG